MDSKANLEHLPVGAGITKKKDFYNKKWPCSAISFI